LENNYPPLLGGQKIASEAYTFKVGSQDAYDCASRLAPVG